MVRTRWFLRMSFSTMILQSCIGVLFLDHLEKRYDTIRYDIGRRARLRYVRLSNNIESSNSQLSSSIVTNRFHRNLYFSDEKEKKFSFGKKFFIGVHCYDTMQYSRCHF